MTEITVTNKGSMNLKCDIIGKANSAAPGSVMGQVFIAPGGTKDVQIVKGAYVAIVETDLVGY